MRTELIVRYILTQEEANIVDDYINFLTKIRFLVLLVQLRKVENVLVMIFFHQLIISVKLASLPLIGFVNQLKDEANFVTQIAKN